MEQKMRGDGMKDLIYRQSAINAIENTECELLACEWDELTDAIKQVPSAQQWIPVTKRVPTELLDRRMLVSTISPSGFKAVDIGVWDGNKWTTYFPLWDDKVTACMPVPEPYEGGDAK